MKTIGTKTAAEVEVGDVLQVPGFPGFRVSRIVKADHAPFFLRFYSAFTIEVVEFLPHDLVTVR